MPETFSEILILGIYALGLLFIIWELLTPGFVIGLFGLLLMICSIFLAFYYYPHIPFFGIALVAFAMIVVPFAFNWIFKRTTLRSAQNVTDGYTSAAENLQELVGKTGITVTLLRPSGIALIEGRRLDVTTNNVVVAKQTPVEVVRIENGHIVVRATGAPVQEE